MRRRDERCDTDDALSRWEGQVIKKKDVFNARDTYQGYERWRYSLLRVQVASACHMRAQPLRYLCTFATKGTNGT